VHFFCLPFTYASIIPRFRTRIRISEHRRSCERWAIFVTEPSAPEKLSHLMDYSFTADHGGASWLL